MDTYVVSQTRELTVEANSAAEARSIAQAVLFAKPGFNMEVRKSMHTTKLIVEKVRQ